MTHSGGNRAQLLGRLVGSAGNETTLRSSAGAKGETQEPSPWTRASNRSREDGETLTLKLSIHCLDDSQFITLRMKSGSYIRFQADTGAQCNVLPLDTYKRATGDKTLSKITPANTRITAYYVGATLSVVGSVVLRVWREKTKYRLECKLVDSPKIRPLLGRKACLGMKVIKYLDNDAINKPDTGNAPVYALESAEPVSMEQLEKDHPDVFGPGVGLLVGKYHIVLDDSVHPVQHPPRRVPVPLRHSRCVAPTVSHCLALFI